MIKFLIASVFLSSALYIYISYIYFKGVGEMEDNVGKSIDMFYCKVSSRNKFYSKK